MSALDRIRRLRPRLRRDRDAPPPGLVAADKLAALARREAARGADGAAGSHGADPELLARRARLTERFALLQADLGGVFYEMAIRDHVRMDVLTRKAAELQRVDADLAQVERELCGEDGAPAGACPACGAPNAPSSRFCSTCGQTLAGAGGRPPHEIARTNDSPGAAT